MVELQSPKLMVEVRFLVGPPTIKKSPKGDFLIIVARSTRNRKTEPVDKTSKASACRRVGVASTLAFVSNAKQKT